MRKLMIVAAILMVLAWVTTLAVPTHTAYQFNSPQIAGDDGPGGG
jgi:hypothetical protein